MELVLKSFYLLLLLLLSSCNKNTNINSTLAEKRLKLYCHGEKCSFKDFKKQNLYMKKDLGKNEPYDYCIEYITKDNVKPKHILILYFVNNKIVEQHRLIE